MWQLVIFLAFASALLYLAADRQESALLVWLVAGLFGLLVAILAPRRKMLLSLVPPLGGFIISWYLAYREGVTDLTVIVNIWVPIALSALVGAVFGTRLKLLESPRPLRPKPHSTTKRPKRN